RHTRSKRDWSSDVCSSDLVRRRAVPPPELTVLSKKRTQTGLTVPANAKKPGPTELPLTRWQLMTVRSRRKAVPTGGTRTTGRTRSEERRRGEGGRWREERE